MTLKAFQDCYPEEFAHCFGCGRLNEHGLKIKSYWEGEEGVCRYEPPLQYTGGYPGFVYGGFLCSLIDCHSSATASAAYSRAMGFPELDGPFFRFVTASLKIDFLKPTRIDKTLELRSRIVEMKDRKIVVSTVLSVEGDVCVKGEGVMVRIPENSAP